MKPLVSVLILNYNGTRFIERCIESLLCSDYDNFEIIVIDNNSTDGSVEIVRGKFSCENKVKVVVNDQNFGFAEGYNRGLPYVHPKSKYLIFLSQDTEVSQNWLSELVKFMESHSEVGAAHSKVLLMGEGNIIDSAGHFLDYLGFTYQRGQNEEDRDLYHTGEVTYVYGASFIIRREVIKDILLFGSLFDPSYFYYHEDTDLSWRVRMRGHRIYYVSTSVVWHAYGGSSMEKGIPSILVFHHTKNRASTLIKNYELKNLAIYLPSLLILELGRVVATMVKTPSHGRATLRALVWILKNFRRLWAKRLFVQKNIRVVGDSRVKAAMIPPNFHLIFKKYRSYLHFSRD